MNPFGEISIQTQPKYHCFLPKRMAFFYWTFSLWPFCQSSLCYEESIWWMWQYCFSGSWPLQQDTALMEQWTPKKTRLRGMNYVMHFPILGNFLFSFLIWITTPTGLPVIKDWDLIVTYKFSWGLCSSFEWTFASEQWD